MKAAADAGGGGRVLLVEEDESLRRSYSAVLEARGIRGIDTAASAGAALAAARRGRYLAVFVDATVDQAATTEGVDLLAELQEVSGGAAVFLVTSASQLANAPPLAALAPPLATSVPHRPVVGVVLRDGCAATVRGMMRAVAAAARSQSAADLDALADVVGQLDPGEDDAGD